MLLVLFFIAFVTAEEARTLNTFIVVYNDDMTVEELESHKTTLLGAREAFHTYTNVFRGFAAELYPEDVIEVQKHPKFRMMEQDQIMSINQVACSAFTPVESWGLGRISKKILPLPSSFRNPTTAGAGVDAYIIDTGIYTQHNDFQPSRAVFSFKANSSWTDGDGNGHGTHVASTTGGNLYGIAKASRLFAVKVLGDNGSGSNAGVIAGVDHVRGKAGVGKRIVANMSLGGGASAALDLAVDNAVKAGIFFAVAAGNDNQNACNYSPARAAEATTVGSTTITDGRSSFSNWGTCVKILAPGSNIKAAWNTGVSSTNTISGTSMASPHVCGVGALIWGSEAGLSAAGVKKRVLDSTSDGQINLLCPTQPAGNPCPNTPNKLLFNEC